MRKVTSYKLFNQSVYQLVNSFIYLYVYWSVIDGDPHFVDPVEVCHFVSNDHTSGYMSSITRMGWQ